MQGAPSLRLATGSSAMRVGRGQVRKGRGALCSPQPATRSAGGGALESVAHRERALAQGSLAAVRGRGGQGQRRRVTRGRERWRRRQLGERRLISTQVCAGRSLAAAATLAVLGVAGRVVAGGGVTDGGPEGVARPSYSSGQR